MNNFKYFTLKNLSDINKLNIKRKKAFTFVEVILVMTLISVLYIVTTKVIQHNLEKKVPTYVYYLYKNLNNETKLLTKKLLESANKEGSSSGSNSEETNGTNNNTSKKTIEEVLKNLDAKSYCEAFAEDTNLVGHIDCENSSKEEEIATSINKVINYTCNRSYNFNVNNNGTYNEIFSPIYRSTLQDCINNKDFSSLSFQCNAQPKILIDNLVIPNTDKSYTYNCTKEEELKEENEGILQNIYYDNFNISEKLNLPNAIKTTNNIYLNFMALASADLSLIYNLKAKISQDSICPEVNIKEDQEDFIFVDKSIFDYVIDICNCHSYHSNLSSGQFLCIWGANHYLYARINGKKIQTDRSGIGTNQKCYKEIDTCYGRIENLQVQKNLLNIFGSGRTLTFHHNQSGKNYGTFNQKWPFKDYFYGESEAYYNKWSNFFNKIGKKGTERLTIEAINDEFDEGTFFNTNSQIDENGNKTYLTHFIYASIDTPFSKGKMNKDIFVFEHFKDKIIPVGYLASDKNTPLKFDVITRDPVTYKIKKINDKPLTYCEAMEYTGEEFSKYCNCKDKDDNIVTQYTKIEACNNNFGCIIKPVKP